MELLAVLGFLATGFAAGVLSGMFGVGGAVVSTPAIRALGASPIEAVGSTIPAILPAAISGAHRYAKAGLVDWRIAWTCGVAGTLLALLGAKASDVVDARWLMVATAVLLMWSGISSIRKGLAGPATDATATGAGVEDDAAHVVTLAAAPFGTAPDRPPAPSPISERRRTSASPTAREPDRVQEPEGHPVAGRPTGMAALVTVGALAGFVAGLLGIGGGVIMVPLFTNVLRLPVKTAVASSLVAVAIFSVPAMITHALLGHIDWVVALLLTAGTVPGARLGSRIAIGTAERRMRLLLGGFFCIVAVVYGGRELIGIL